MADIPNSFSKNETLKGSMDFNYLKNKGLEYVQKLSGDIWTDYNLHDPGVTILEQLCFALTDLAYRTAYEVEDLLTKAQNEAKVAENNAFYSPRMIYSRHPVTTEDFRKIIIDRFEEVQNVWIIPLNRGFKEYREEGMSGISEIVIMPSLSFIKKIENTTTEEEQFKSRFKRDLDENRNLGEDFENITLLKSEKLHLAAEININENEKPEQVFAEILFSLEVFLYRPVAISSIGELIQNHVSLEEIFSGPRLKSGFIHDSELKDRETKIHIEDIQRIISKIKGVEKSSNINFGIFKEEMEIPDGKYLKLNLDGSEESVFKTFKLLVKGKKIEVEKVMVENFLFEFWSKNYRTRQEDEFQEEYFNKKLKGKYRDTIQYRSIQHQFPMLYGIGLQGISKSEPLERHSKIKQLKAYLLFFEQHLANHLAQLESLNELFSVKIPEKKITYFSQSLSSVIGIDDILEPIVDTDSNQYPSTKKYDYSFETSEEFFDRKNRLLDHLLARFGENIDELPLLTSRKLNIISENDEYQKKLLKMKSDFLNNLANLNYFQNRGQYFHKEKKEAHLSGLEGIILAKTGIEKRGDQFLPERFYLIDHILLRSFLEESLLGFFILDQHNRKIFISEWVTSEKERIKLLEDFYKYSLEKKNYQIIDGILSVHGGQGELLATYLPEQDHKTITEKEREEIFESNRELAKLMKGDDEELGRLGWKEIEMIRLEGTLNKKEYSQRRVILNRKLENETEFSEDFFDQKVSIVLPDWPVRFQNDGFRKYLKDLIEERVPVHIQATVYWLDLKRFEEFEEEYKNWVKSMAIEANQNSIELKKKSLKLANIIISWERREEDD